VNNEPRISLITLGVADLERSLAFYRMAWIASESGELPGNIIFFDMGHTGGAWALFPC